MTVSRLAIWTFAAWALANAPAAAEVRVEQRGGVLYVMEDSRATAYSAVGRSVSTTGPFSGTAYRDLIKQAAERYALPITLIDALIRVESNFDPRAISSKGARGLMQLMPGTARLLGVHDVFDVAQNIDGGARHLRALVDRYAGNLAVALAAYNAGAEAVTRHGGIPPFAETRAYIDRVLRLAGHTNLSPTVRSVNPTQRAANIHATPAPDSGGDPARSLYRYRATDGTLVYSNHPIRPWH
jgi:soluble lytic murein transglycosylase-like protein